MPDADLAHKSVSRTPRAGGELFDVVIVGAGLSGVGAACHLKLKCPTKTVAIVEARDAIGGTWDFFRYPGIRSDSDMSTFGYSFRPWEGAKAIADGASIVEYIAETAQEFGVDRLVRFGHRLVRASWDSTASAWTLDIERDDGGPIRLACRFLYMCAGYYDYGCGYMPGWRGMERFSGRIVHPQDWPAGLDCAGKRVLVIGSGATAVTLVPALAKTAAKVTMLQRSPTFVVARPSEDPIATWLLDRLPRRAAQTLTRWANIALQMYFYRLARRRPDKVRASLLKLAQHELGAGFDAAALFDARYNPWDQRLCLAPDGDLFRAIREGKAAVVNGEIETFTETGLALRSGEQLKADVIVTATGLVVRLMGGAELIVDGKLVDVGKSMTYKGAMLDGVPNLGFAIGYANASWTLKCDLSANYVCRLLNHMDRRVYAVATPRAGTGAVSADSAIPLNSGYLRRARALLPRQGAKRPWRINQNYALDLIAFRFSAIEDGALAFKRSGAAKAAV